MSIPMQQLAADLAFACQQGNSVKVQAIVSQYPDAIRFPDSNGWTALHHACAAGASLDIVHALITANPPVLAVASSTDKRTVLHCAAASPDTKLEVMEFLIQQGNTLIKELDTQGRSALHWVCQGSPKQQGRSHAGLDIVSAIYKGWTDAIFLPDQQGQLPIHLAYLSSAPGSQMRYLASLDPSSVSTPLPNGRLISHGLAADLMEGKKDVAMSTLEALVQVDPATVYIQDPFTGKTLMETAQEPSFRKLDNAQNFQNLIQGHGTRGGGVGATSVQGSPKDAKLKKDSSTLSKTDKLEKGSTAKVVGPGALGISKEQMADKLILACSQPTSSQEDVRLLLKACPEAVKVRDVENFLPLHWACYHGAPASVLKLLLDAWPESIRETISQDRLPLHLACRATATLDRIQVLVQRYPKSIETPTSQGMLPIHYACRDAASLDVIQFLIDENPMSLSEANGNGLLPIHLACKHAKSFELIQFLVERWPGCLREPAKDDMMPIHFLCRGGSSAPIEWMIKQDPHLLEMADASGNLPLHLLCKNAKSTVEMIRIVLDVYPEAASQQNSKSATPGEIAAEVNTEIANFLEAAMLSKRRKTGGNHPLHQACSNPRVTVEEVKNILAESPDEVCVPDEERCLPIHVACRSGASLEVIQCLVEDWQESLRWTNKGGSVPLHTACSNKADSAVVQYLITSWPKATNVANKYGWLPLHCACAYGASSDVISLLVRSNDKSPRMATYGQGDYPLHLACCGSPSLEVIFWLIEAREEGARLVNSAGELALHKACFNNAPIEVVQFLVEQYPQSLSAVDQYGSTPQRVAEMRKNMEVAEWLRNKEE